MALAALLMNIKNCPLYGLTPLRSDHDEITPYRVGEPRPGAGVDRASRKGRIPGPPQGICRGTPRDPAGTGRAGCVKEMGAGKEL
jgi:hypothetical protein